MQRGVMCNANNPLASTGPGAPLPLMPFGLKFAGAVSHGTPGTTLGLPAALHLPGTPTSVALEIHRAQMMDFNARVRLSWQYAAAVNGGVPASPLGMPYPGPTPPIDPLAYLYSKQDPRGPRYMHEEPKPSHSYIGLIGMAILGSKDGKLVLSDIYQWILDNYPYFRTRGPGWRNSIRHNLSLNDCFIKAGRSANGKGHYWAVHPANVEDFSKGDFRRRRAQRKVRKAMGLAVPDEEDSPSPTPPSTPIRNPLDWQNRLLLQPITVQPAANLPCQDGEGASSPCTAADLSVPVSTAPKTCPPGTTKPSRKRLFDVESLLAPDPAPESTSSVKEIAPATEKDVGGEVQSTGGVKGDDDDDDADVDVEDDDEDFDGTQCAPQASACLQASCPQYNWPDVNRSTHTFARKSLSPSTSSHADDASASRSETSPEVERPDSPDTALLRSACIGKRMKMASHNRPTTPQELVAGKQPYFLHPSGLPLSVPRTSRGPLWFGPGPHGLATATSPLSLPADGPSAFMSRGSVQGQNFLQGSGILTRLPFTGVVTTENHHNQINDEDSAPSLNIEG